MSAYRCSRLLLIAGFVIWVVYGFLAGMGRWPVAVAFGLVSSIALVLVEARHHIKIKLMDWTIVAYFVVAAVATFLIRAAAFPLYASVVIWVLYAGVTWASILLGAPFSLQYARESAPREHWQRPEFFRANRIISVIWGIAFAINIVLVIVALNPRSIPLLTGVAAPLLLMGVAATFTSHYTRIARARMVHPIEKLPRSLASPG